jgi:hypothetical protein
VFTARYGLDLYVRSRLVLMFNWSVLRLRRLVIGLSPRRLGIDAGPVHVRFMVDIVAPEEDFLRVLRFSAVSSIPL